jgi:hypothetical protein
VTAPAVWWSPTEGQFESRHQARPQLIHTRYADGRRRHEAKRVDALPADAVRLVPDDMDLLSVNERMGEALVQIGLALGLPRPSPRIRWGAPEILARIASMGAAGEIPQAESVTLDDLTTPRCPVRLRVHEDGRWAVYESPDSSLPWTVGGAGGYARAMSDEQTSGDGWREPIVLDGGPTS